jgi:hypothetical protein
MRNVHIYYLLFCVLGLGLVGCSTQTNAQITGTVLNDGQPISVGENEELTLSFHAVDPDAKVNLAFANYDRASGVFTLFSPTQPGVPPGEYKISLSYHPYQQENKDRFAGDFSAEKTPLRYTVPDTASQEIVIDVAKKTVTKK